jgi:hypothetical protein
MWRRAERELHELPPDGSGCGCPIPRCAVDEPGQPASLQRTNAATCKSRVAAFLEDLDKNQALVRDLDCRVLSVFLKPFITRRHFCRSSVRRSSAYVPANGCVGRGTDHYPSWASSMAAGSCSK